MSTAIVWFRRDLRLADNPALSVACAKHSRVIAVYIHAPDEELPWQPGAASRWWLHQSLGAVRRSLEGVGGRLRVFAGASLETLERQAKDERADAVYWNRLYDPATLARDRTVQRALRERGLEAESFRAALLHEPWELTKADGSPYQVFTPYWKAALGRLPPPAPLPEPPDLRRRIDSTAPEMPLEALNLLPGSPWDCGLAEAWQPGEAGARQRLARFCDERLAGYHESRDRPDEDGVSRLSPHLHFGEISPTQVWQAVSIASGGRPAFAAGPRTFLSELGWREFAHTVLYHWPDTSEHPLQARFEHFPWRADDGTLLRAWQRGRTGIPLVDAGMRELWHTGWMHNRVRMVTASYLTKHLRLPWQDGARWFWDTLVDADLANNTMGWQWTAGCGTDAAPYFRVFNPVIQGERFDPDGRYVRRWVPEIAALPDRWLQQPWAAPDPVVHRAGVRLGSDYPRPLVNLAAARREALAAYERVRW